MTNETNKELEKQIYDILYSKSRVDGIRLCNEDEWPIEELAELIQSESRKAVTPKWLLDWFDEQFSSSEFWLDAKNYPNNYRSIRKFIKNNCQPKPQSNKLSKPSGRD